ncbi:MAG TPA: N-acetylmuramoyl-L-alanine amidase [Pusillimonas sp.]|uniref:N-acetylmuramoyl-L-alanine amidase n=1 Tax=Pusillimonas sp. TaxID=3040095 RepID=UPI002C40FC3A|nr:N-acetylmuramoyl-L-alanine amidase [Pusillimonas sp.]HUH87874.1 N-acetylmuramoyl-L-alanine amidase [Pusillimonas sp.]
MTPSPEPKSLSKRIIGSLAVVCAALILAGCGTPPTRPPVLSIDRSIQAQAQNSRVEFVVLHYTSASNERSLELLSRRNVSSHYLITNEAPPRVYQLVDETRRAWHAGVSQWYERTDLNAASIGIEIVNPGGAGSSWAPYSQAQIDTLLLLLADIAGRHQIKHHNIVGHSDIAPQRKVDPGPLFPWKTLAEAGLARWYDETLAAQYRVEFEQQGLAGIAWVQGQLARVGYNVPKTGRLDKATRNVITAFQMRYRPSLYDGLPDAQTLAILKSLP